MSVTWPDGVKPRQISGANDYDLLAQVYNAGADGIDFHVKGPEIEHQFAHTENLDVDNGLILVECDGEPVGYIVARWRDELSGTRIYRHLGVVIPEYRRRGIGSAMLKWAQTYLVEIAATQPTADQQFQTSANEDDAGVVAMLESDGYGVVSHDVNMVRPTLEDIPHRTLPDGVEIRPVEPDHMRAIWEADTEAFRDHAGATEPTELEWEAFVGDPGIQPHLWKVAWHGDRVVGQVRSFINEETNAEIGRQRGYTEDISTIREWRGKGIAGALICESLKELKQQGMTEAALGVHVENPNGAFRLYEGLGYQATSHFAEYQRPFLI